MKKALVFMANGFEEIEALTVVDILRRADVQVDLCSIQKTLEVQGAHGVKVSADILLSQLTDPEQYDAVITPGGLPGSTNLRDNDRVVEIIQSFFGKEGKIIGSICASPMVLGRAGIAAQIKGTCYPGCEGDVGYKEYVKEKVVLDQHVITSMGPATSIYFALKMVEELVGKGVAQELKEGTMLQFTEDSLKK